MNKYVFGLLLLSTPAFAGLDYQCMTDCTNRNYSYAYCKQSCTIYEPRAQPRPASPVDAFIRGQEARQEYDAREIELERMRAEQARREALAEQEIWAEVARQAAETKRHQEAEERERLKAENEALQKKLNELEASKQQSKDQ